VCSDCSIEHKKWGKNQYKERLPFDEAKFYNVKIFFKTASKMWQQWFRGEK